MRLLDALADDVWLDDPTLLAPLTAVEAAITGTPASRAPSTILLIRSIAVAVRRDPTLRGRTVAELLAPLRLESTTRSVEEREPQVA